MPRIHLRKFEATGNDFLVLVDLDDQWRSALTPEMRAHLCDRERGIGADGLIRVLPGTSGAPLTFELTNADGGPAEMSGNGMRCLAAVAVWDGLVPGTVFDVATPAGVKRVEYAETTEGAFARVDMGPASFEPDVIPVDADSAFGLEASAGPDVFSGDAAGMGNPHFVVFVDDPDAVPVAEVGPVLEHDARFPHRTNVEFVCVPARDRIRMRVWERGVGETQSCGTGACAAAAVSARRGLVDSPVTVEVPGGRLTVELGATIWLGGPVSHVTDATVDLVELGGGA
ncbi:MAG TPA: diaminopimelate epimerase [Acidimicrobiia bacterium]|nr:diaminopimelate epimerase [Acidimicrobiia bacterium]